MHGSVDRSITDQIASLIKGMIIRGDDQSDIAACFRLNGGRISEINTGKRFAHVKPARPEDLPPPPPYPSPYESWKLQHSLWSARVVVETAIDHLQKINTAIENAEKRLGK